MSAKGKARYGPGPANPHDCEGTVIEIRTAKLFNLPILVLWDGRIPNTNSYEPAHLDKIPILRQLTLFDLEEE